MCTRERTLQFQLTEEEKEEEEEEDVFTDACVKRVVVERGVKRVVAENAQFHARASLSRRAESAIRTGSGVVENAYPPLRPSRDASDRAPRFSRINEPRANYPPPCKLSWKYWKVGGVEWLLPVSGTTILLSVARRSGSDLTAIYERRGEKEK